MATGTDVRTPTRDPAPGRRRATLAIVVAGALVVATVAGILVFGYVPLPSFPALADDPDPGVEGQIALVYEETGEELTSRRCLAVVAARDGDRREVLCETDWPPEEAVAWTAEGQAVLIRREGPGEGARPARVIDVDTGEEVSRGEVPAGAVDEAFPWSSRDDARADGTRAVVEAPAGGTTRLVRVDPDGTRTVLLDVDGPGDYRFTGTQWSPDGEWLLVTDSRARLLVADPDASGEARLLTELGAERWPLAPAAWYQPGFDEGTVEVSPPDAA